MKESREEKYKRWKEWRLTETEYQDALYILSTQNKLMIDDNLSWQAAERVTAVLYWHRKNKRERNERTSTKRKEK